MKHRASYFSRSLCETFAFATSETVSIGSGNRLIQAVGNVRSLNILHILHILNIKHIYFVQHAFDPAGIEFNTFPTMAQRIVGAMLPEHDAKIHKLSLHERKLLWLEMCIYDTFCIFIIFCIFNIFLSQQWMAINLWISIELTPC